jgi:hypothetical protein
MNTGASPCTDLSFPGEPDLQVAAVNGASAGADEKTRRQLEASMADSRFTWRDYESRFDPGPLRDAQVIAEHDDDLEPTRREAVSLTWNLTSAAIVTANC